MRFPEEFQPAWLLRVTGHVVFAVLRLSKVSWTGSLGMTIRPKF
jgi:hypothetical protein